MIRKYPDTFLLSFFGCQFPCLQFWAKGSLRAVLNSPGNGLSAGVISFALRLHLDVKKCDRKRLEIHAVRILSNHTLHLHLVPAVFYRQDLLWSTIIYFCNVNAIYILHPISNQISQFLSNFSDMSQCYVWFRIPQSKK